MSQNKDFIPKNDAEFNEWQAHLITYVTNNKVRFNIPDPALDSLKSLQSLWSIKYGVADNPETRTSPSVRVKSEVRKNYVAELRKFIKPYLQYNPFVEDEDRNHMALPVHSTSRRPAPEPATFPDFDVDTSVMRRLTIRFRDTGKKSTAKPRGVRGAEIRWAMLPHPPAGIDEIVNSEFDTNSPFTLEFRNEERGKIVYFCLRWENTRGVKGPWGEIGNAIVP